MVTELRDGVYHIGGLSAANVFLVDDDGVSLIDAGTPGDAADVEAGIEAAGFDVSDVDRVLLTHYDFDHVGALAKLDALDATVYAHEPDAGFLTGEASPGWWPHKALLQRLTGVFLERPSVPVERVSDGDRVAGFTAYHTPGHGPGHVAWVSESLETAFLGDLVRESDGALQPSPWFVSYDTDEVARSIRSLSAEAPSFAVAGMGHGEPITEHASDALARLASAV